MCCQVCCRHRRTRLVRTPWDALLWLCDACAESIDRNDTRHAVMPPDFAWVLP